MLAGCGCPEGQQAVRTYVTGLNGRPQEHYQCMTTFRMPDFSGDVNRLQEGFRRGLELQNEQRMRELREKFDNRRPPYDK